MPLTGGHHDVRRANAGGLENIEEARLALFQGAHVANDQSGSLSGSTKVRQAPGFTRRVALEGNQRVLRRHQSHHRHLTRAVPEQGQEARRPNRASFHALLIGALEG
jgi:hypothetical protein